MSKVIHLPIGNIVEKIIDYRGKSPRKASQGIPLITAKIIKGKTVQTPTEFIPADDFESWMKRGIPREGDVIITTEAPMGEVALVPSYRAAYAQRLLVLQPNLTMVFPKYLLYSLLTNRVTQQMQRRSTGSTVKGIRSREFKKVQIPLPPLPEQKRIAKILDQADALRAKRREAIAQLDAFLQSTFLDMFGDPVTNPKGWELCTVGNAVHSAKDGPHVSPKYSDKGIPFLSTRHIKPGEVVWEDLKHISQEEADCQWKKCKPEFGDILYTKGGTTGIAARVNTLEPFAIWVHVALLKPIHEKVDPAWLESMLNSSYCYQQSQRYTHGIANRDLGLKRMVKIKIYLPPLPLQNQFADIVTKVEAQKQQMRDHLTQLDTLFASLQSRAFNGDL